MKCRCQIHDGDIEQSVGADDATAEECLLNLIRSDNLECVEVGISNHEVKEGNRIMKKRLVVGVMSCLAVGVLVTGCMSPSGRPDYTATGAVTGAILGSTARNSGAGALVGAVVGGIIGHGMDQAQEAQLRAQAPQTLQRVEQSQPLTIVDIKALVKAGIGDDLVISQIRNSRTVYRLSTAAVIDLKNSGISEKIIDFMINTATQLPPAEVAGVVGVPPPPPMVETVVVAPGPDYIWVGGLWGWHGDRWIWHPGYWHRPMYPPAYGRHW
jgi:hypothetical protein